MKTTKNKQQAQPFTDLDNMMVTAAHRYCLGRQSYIVGCGMEWLTLNWNRMDDRTRYLILRDTYEALMDGYAGGETDTKEWKAFADRMLVSLDPVKRGNLIVELAGRTNKTGIIPELAGEKEQP